MLTTTAPGLDLEASFEQALQGFGLSPAAAHRKISAAVQQRIGPEYAGALGVLQPIADGMKLVFKEDIIPARADGLLFTLGPVLVLIPVILSWLVVPFGQRSVAWFGLAALLGIVLLLQVSRWYVAQRRVMVAATGAGGGHAKDS